MTKRPFKDSLSLRLALSLTLPRTVTRWLILQKARRHPAQVRRRGLSGLRLLVGTRFQVLFHSPLGVLFTFPSRYWFTIGRWRVFSLGGWSPQIPTGFHVSGSTQVSISKSLQFRVRGFYPLWPAVPSRSATTTFCNFAIGLMPYARESHNPTCSNAIRLTHTWV